MDDDVAIVMVPFPLQGHLNQLLHLSRLLSGRRLPVHYLAVAAHSRQARRRIHGCDPLSFSNVIFHDYPSPSSPSLTTSTLQPLLDAATSLRRPLTELLRCLSPVCRRVVIIYDSLMGSVVQDFVKFPNAEAYTFHSVSAYTIFFFLWESLGRPFHVDSKVLEGLPSIDGCFTPEFKRFIAKQHKFLGLNSGRIYNTSRVIEDSFLDLISKPEISGNKQQWALGPFNPIVPSVRKLARSSTHWCLKWLDRQETGSVIFVSFGTATTFSAKQINEIASGLEISNVKFVWSLRKADATAYGGSSVGRIELPAGYEERIKERGVVVRDWAPQLEILGHSAVGGFLSHCGWNSCMESISMGVPIAAWPVHSDQPRNTVLVAEVLKIAVIVKEWGRSEEEVVEAEAVKRAVRRLMVTEEGAEMRRRAAELGVAVAEGGSRNRELDSFVKHIRRSGSKGPD